MNAPCTQAGTYNVNGRKPSPTIQLSEWLGSLTTDWPHDADGPAGADIVAVGFQEVVPLNAGNVIAGKQPHDSVHCTAHLACGFSSFRWDGGGRQRGAARCLLQGSSSALSLSAHAVHFSARHALYTFHACPLCTATTAAARPHVPWCCRGCSGRCVCMGPCAGRRSERRGMVSVPARAVTSSGRCFASRNPCWPSPRILLMRLTQPGQNCVHALQATRVVWLLLDLQGRYRTNYRWFQLLEPECPDRRSSAQKHPTPPSVHTT
jgi:hypothetical protein